MGSLQRGRAFAKEAAGKVQKKAGRLMGSEKTEAEGRARELEGRAEREAVEAKERAKGRVEEVAGRVQQGVGRAIADDEMEAKGAVRRAKGVVRRKANES
jgi:uncharacterized protein YjbJ (UPF0337 family)